MKYVYLSWFVVYIDVFFRYHEFVYLKSPKLFQKLQYKSNTNSKTIFFHLQVYNSLMDKLVERSKKINYHIWQISARFGIVCQIWYFLTILVIFPMSLANLANFLQKLPDRIELKFAKSVSFLDKGLPDLSKNDKIGKRCTINLFRVSSRVLYRK